MGILPGAHIPDGRGQLAATTTAATTATAAVRLIVRHFLGTHIPDSGREFLPTTTTAAVRLIVRRFLGTHIPDGRGQLAATATTATATTAAAVCLIVRRFLSTHIPDSSGQLAATATTAAAVCLIVCRFLSTHIPDGGREFLPTTTAAAVRLIVRRFLPGGQGAARGGPQVVRHVAGDRRQQLFLGGLLLSVAVHVFLPFRAADAIGRNRCPIIRMRSARAAEGPPFGSGPPT
ncbi:hypothetical protein [Kitasatospora sp. NPDC101183]|uniref:hypothetical protein n=1 Tax=Kitasatospora sp. NPDC101183 TaxID=3364100 RepID=UPI0037FE2EC8